MHHGRADQAARPDARPFLNSADLLGILVPFLTQGIAEEIVDLMSE